MGGSSPDARMRIHCCGCDRLVDARLTDGAEIYPSRPDLAYLPFWRCDVCTNAVGCHYKSSDPTRPLGVIPTPELKEVRKRLHAVIDPIWRSGRMSRSAVYEAISQELGYEFHASETRTLEAANAALLAASKLA